MCVNIHELVANGAKTVILEVCLPTGVTLMTNLAIFFCNVKLITQLPGWSVNHRFMNIHLLGFKNYML